MHIADHSLMYVLVGAGTCPVHSRMVSNLPWPQPTRCPQHTFPMSHDCQTWLQTMPQVPQEVGGGAKSPPVRTPALLGLLQRTKVRGKIE